tara:strand:- start:1344 stop:1511 length:168 start_codon:yes stop_codon:yes gene_type:complete
MARPTQQEIDRVIKENKETFRLAGVNTNKKGRLTKEEVARLNAALKLLRSKKAKA